MRHPLLLLVICGCDLPSSSGRTFVVQSDSGNITIDACAEMALGGCSSGDTPLSAVLDGVRTDLPPRSPALLDSSYDHELVAPSPRDPSITLISGLASLSVEELPWFKLDVPTTPIGRAPIDVDFEVYPKATVVVELNTICDDGALHSEPLVPAGHTIHLSFPASTTACTHVLFVTQTFDVANEVDTTVRVGRRERPTFVTTP